MVRAVQGDVDELLAGERAPARRRPHRRGAGPPLRRSPSRTSPPTRGCRRATPRCARLRVLPRRADPLAGRRRSAACWRSTIARRRRWQPDEIAALEAFANSATVALQNALLYERVAQEKERSEAILASIADAIVVVGADGRVEQWNRGRRGDDRRAGPHGPAPQLRRPAAHRARRPLRRRAARILGEAAASAAARSRCGCSAAGARSGSRSPPPSCATRVEDRPGDGLRAARRLGGPPARPAQVGLRGHGLARAAHAADVDLRLRGDAAARRRRLRRRRPRDVPAATSPRSPSA